MSATDIVFSPERWLVGLYFMLPPSRVKLDEKKKIKTEELYIRLDTIKEDVITKTYDYEKFDFLIVCFYAVASNYVLDMLWRTVSGNQDTTIGSMSAIILLFLAGRALFQLASQKSIKTGEGMLSFWFGVSAFILSFAALQRNRFLIFDIDQAYQMLKRQVDHYLQETDLPLTLTSESAFLKFGMAVLCGLISYLTFTPTVRFVRSHLHLHDELMTKAYTESQLRVLGWLSWVNMLLPLIFVLVCFKPFLDAVSLFYMRVDTLYTILFYLALAIAISRLLFVRTYIQSFLLSAGIIVLGSFGRIRDDNHLQMIKDQVLNFLRFVMVATIHLISFPLIMFGFAMMMNSKGRASFFPQSVYEFLISTLRLVDLHKYLGYYEENHDSSIITHRQNIQHFYSETVSFLAWWTCLSAVIFTLLALLYFKFVDNAHLRATSTAREVEERSRKKKQ
jgi:hypothetical protein